MPDSLTLADAGLPGIRQMYGHYKQAFPEAERKPYDRLAALVRGGKYRILLARDTARDKVVGYAFVYHDDATAWLDYLEVLPEFRSGGYGARLFSALIDGLGPGQDGLYLEVDRPQPGETDSSDAVRRIRFYERLGTRRLQVNYELPTAEGACPMYLYFKPKPGAGLPSRAAWLRSVEAVFQYVHSDISAAAAILARLTWLADGEGT